MIRRLLDRLMPSRNSDKDAQVKAALNESRLVAAQVRQWVLEEQFYRRLRPR